MSTHLKLRISNSYIILKNNQWKGWLRGQRVFLRQSFGGVLF